MTKLSKFTKIGQFREVIKTVRDRTAYIGRDENDAAMYDHTIPYPTIAFKGSVKLHGTNAAVAFNTENGIWAQSRENVITPMSDNAGFAAFVHKNETEFLTLIEQVINTEEIETTDTVIIYGEWAGKGVQKGVGISQLEKSFFIFDTKIKPADDELPSYYVDSDYLRLPENRIFNIEDYQTFSIDIDFANPEFIQNQLQELTMEVEKQCPVSTTFDIEGLGEGIVWSAYWKGNKLRFKVKGEKHQNSKVKTLTTVDVEKVKNIKEFVEYAVTPNRMEQGLGIIFPDGNLDIKKLGQFIKWVRTDTLAEEMDTLLESGLEVKDVNGGISNTARNYFLVKYNDLGK